MRRSPLIPRVSTRLITRSTAQSISRLFRLVTSLLLWGIIFVPYDFALNQLSLAEAKPTIHERRQDTRLKT